MGNLASCLFMNPEEDVAKIIDLHGNLRRITLPMTAAELMLDEPGHVVSAVDEIRSTSRFSPMKAEDQLSTGRVYVLVLAVRLHSKLSDSDMILVESACRKRRPKRPTSKVLPALLKEYSKKPGSPVRLRSSDNDACLSSTLVRQWRPALDPISEV